MPRKTFAQITHLPFTVCLMNHEAGGEELEHFDADRFRSYLGREPELPVEAAVFVEDFEGAGDTVVWVKDAQGGMLYHRDFPGFNFPEIADLIGHLLVSKRDNPRLRERMEDIQTLLRGGGSPKLDTN